MPGTERTTQAGGLPVELTQFIGRSAELEEVKAALGQERLVTLMGSGGVGKTRIGLRVAREVQEDFPGGVYFVELSALRDPELLANAVSSVVDLTEQCELRARTQLDALLRYFADQRILLVLDTCEHLIDACARFARAVLQHCPQVRILATSRQPLDAPGEFLLQIMPLHAPDPDDPDDTERLAEPSDAMLLFAERAAAVVRGFHLADGNCELVARLCHRLDGIPLAIELAVVRLRALPLEQLLNRLDDRFRLLSGGSRAALPRHQTLRTAIRWSYDLCSPEEQLLWTRLSVFAGEFELTAAEEVCSGGDLTADGILDQLIGLVDKAIVLHIDDESGARYRMLDTIREFGRERLVDIGEEREYRIRHRDHYLALVGEFAHEWLSGDQVPWVRRLWRERPSLRGALEFSCTSAEEAPKGLELATSLWGLWLCMGRVDEGRYWLDRLLPMCPEPDPVRMRALYVAGHLTGIHGLNARGVYLGDEAWKLAEDLGDASAKAYVTMVRGVLDLLSVAPQRAMELITDARGRFVALGDRGGEAWALVIVTVNFAIAGRWEEALTACKEALTVLDTAGERWLQSWAMWGSGCALWGLDRFEESREALRTSLVMSHEINNIQAIAMSFETLAWITAALGQYDQAAKLLGTAAKLWEQFAEPQVGVPSWQQASAAAAERTRQALGEVRYRRLHDKGAALPLHEAVALAVNTTTYTAETGADREVIGWAALTDREQEIALLVTDGLSNRQIAEDLVISKRTVDSHVERILGKLGCSSRTQVAHHAAGRPTAAGTPNPPSCRGT